jgi:WD40 repeat protein
MADFTEKYKQTGSLVKFSPNGELVATAIQKRLVIRETCSMQILQLYNCLDTIQNIEFSQDSELILVCSYKLGCFQVFNVNDETWTAQIEEGALGCKFVKWVPDSRHILSFSNFEVRLTVWSLITGKAFHIPFPKYSDRGYHSLHRLRF